MLRPSPLRGLVLLLFLPSFLLSCKKEQMGDCFKSRGERVVQERSIKGVRKIELHDHVKLRIVMGQEEGVKVRAGKNLLPLIKTRKKGARLVIRDLNTCDWVRSYDAVPQVIVRTERLTHLKNHSTADITMKGKIGADRFHYSQRRGMGHVELRFAADTIWLKQHNGSADIQCYGSVEKANLFLGGHGFMDLIEMECRKAWAHNKGSGNIKVNVKEKLGARVESIGSIIYKGPGELGTSIDEGEGKIRRIP